MTTEENTTKIVCQPKWLRSNPKNAAPAANAPLKTVMQKVNCKAEIRFQHICIANASTPILSSTIHILMQAIKVITNDLFCQKALEKAIIPTNMAVTKSILCSMRTIPNR